MLIIGEAVVYDDALRLQITEVVVYWLRWQCTCIWGGGDGGSSGGGDDFDDGGDDDDGDDDDETLDICHRCIHAA